MYGVLGLGIPKLDQLVCDCYLIVFSVSLIIFFSFSFTFTSDFIYDALVKKINATFSTTLYIGCKNIFMVGFNNWVLHIMQINVYIGCINAD